MAVHLSVGPSVCPSVRVCSSSRRVALVRFHAVTIFDLSYSVGFLGCLFIFANCLLFVMRTYSPLV